MENDSHTLDNPSTKKKFLQVKVHSERELARDIIIRETERGAAHGEVPPASSEREASLSHAGDGWKV
ncbi:unnamed protein product [Danaus chrysippus]|uniref:(African queen) hypothetical protein n=1 Tax=Danaus chrysippus TaxID=151541 RepID=A0A8J2W6Y6_9NEOP|nr:unnamed protein product [Danaus chrysippus]